MYLHHKNFKKEKKKQCITKKPSQLPFLKERHREREREREREMFVISNVNIQEAIAYHGHHPGVRMVSWS
jgi:hypothetical protein